MDVTITLTDAEQEAVDNQVAKSEGLLADASAFIRQLVTEPLSVEVIAFRTAKRHALLDAIETAPDDATIADVKAAVVAGTKLVVKEKI